jgi:hypothetical protein
VEGTRSDDKPPEPADTAWVGAGEPRADRSSARRPPGRLRQDLPGWGEAAVKDAV